MRLPPLPPPRRGLRPRMPPVSGAGCSGSWMGCSSPVPQVPSGPSPKRSSGLGRLRPSPRIVPAFPPSLTGSSGYRREPPVASWSRRFFWSHWLQAAPPPLCGLFCQPSSVPSHWGSWISSSRLFGGDFPRLPIDLPWPPRDRAPGSLWRASLVVPRAVSATPRPSRLASSSFPSPLGCGSVRPAPCGPMTSGYPPPQRTGTSGFSLRSNVLPTWAACTVAPPFRPLLGRLHPEAVFGQARRPLCPPLHPCRQLSAPTTLRRSPP